MTDELEYVVKDALMICDKGAAPGFFRPTHNMHIKISGCLVTNRMDMLPVVNIPTFGVCACTGCACMPAPTMWQKTYKAKVKGQETLLARSYMPCALGGKIQFVTSGQIPLPPDALEDIKELQENGEQEEEEGWGWLDTLELVPVVGSIVGAVREGMKGNWGMMAMNIGFLVMDVAGIVSLGATTAAATAGKAAVKAGVKVAAKTAAKTVAKQTGKTGLKTGLKLTAKGAAKTFTKSIDKIIGKASMGKLCVFACFPAGTKVHTDEGLRNIEDIRAGDRVWSYNEETGEQSLQEVLQTNVRESDHTVELYTDGEKIETTAEHPFYTEGGWKDAADLQAGDRIVSRSGNPIEIKEVSFQYNPKKVYNFEVSNWHTYFVGALAWLVHNAGRCLSQMILESQRWFQKVRRGYFFNLVWNSELRKQALEKGFKYFHEVKVLLKKGGEGAIDGLVRLKDGTYKIIERKASDLTKVTDKTIKSYIDDAAHYAECTIKGTNQSIKKGSEIILHVEKVGPLSEEVKKHAAKKGVKIVDDISKLL